MKRTWRRDAAAYFAHRRRELLRPFVYPDGSRWAVPYPIATCESGDPGAGIYGNYYVGPYGAYGLILEAEWMSPIEQDRIAGQLYREQGEGPWAPFEGECALR